MIWGKNNMARYYHQIDEEQFNEFTKQRKQDNIDSASYLSELAALGLDAKYNLSILHLGMTLQILATALDIKQNEIEKLFKLEKDETRNKKMESIVKELNEKVNLRYGFDEKTEVVPYLYTYKDNGYFMFDKTQFLLLLNEEKYNEIDILNKL